jgi:hypothetical protein
VPDLSGQVPVAFAYLMANPANRRRISRSIEQLNDGRGEMHELIDPEEDDV